MSLSSSLRAAGGQASVEILAVAPLLLVAGTGVGELLAAGAAHELAGHAAEAGAVAIAEGADPRDAVRRAVPGWERERMSIDVHGTRVVVRLRPPAPVRVMEDLLAAEAHADAGRVGP